MRRSLFVLGVAFLLFLAIVGIVLQSIFVDNSNAPSGASSEFMWDFLATSLLILTIIVVPVILWIIGRQKSTSFKNSNLLQKVGVAGGAGLITYLIICGFVRLWSPGIWSNQFLITGCVMLALIVFIWQYNQEAGKMLRVVAITTAIITGIILMWTPGDKTSPALAVITDMDTLSAPDLATRIFVEKGFDKGPMICDCETGLRQFEENGEVVVHTNEQTATQPRTEDVGICSINTTHQEALIAKTGLDPKNLLDNVTLAVEIMNEWKNKGKDPYGAWISTQPCWQKLWEESLEIPLIAPANGEYGPPINVTEVMIAGGFKKGDQYNLFWKPLFSAEDLVTVNKNGRVHKIHSDVSIPVGPGDSLRIKTDSGKEVRKWIVIYRRP